MKRSLLSILMFFIMMIGVMADTTVKMDKTDTPENVFGNKQILDECGISLPTLYTLGKQLNMNPLPKRIEDIDLKKL